jgi:hypothetical protein
MNKSKLPYPLLRAEDFPLLNLRGELEKDKLKQTPPFSQREVAHCQR